ncbi:transcriptional regulator [Mycobacterium asiaticum]|uniref:Transcriptional regulator n=1 Tax=Mycobacterium asiaticum TaxID=1790 RepID=A0A1A3NYL4_MYCAS|nr:helix-turn-helix domain-containing protein [Mycobacterium asiaticum]OBK27103.1 transcriptional regulator [Mycobacterium asiaticum]
MSNIVRPAAEQSGRRQEVLRVLNAANGPMTITAIADVLGVHPNTVRFHLNTLIGDGQVEHAEPDRKLPGRPPLLFRTTRQMDPRGPRRYLLLAEILATSLAAERNPRAKARAAGRAWGLGLPSPPGRGKATSVKKSVDRLIDVLDEFGFAPERRNSSGEQQIGLRHCPFLELAESRSDVICPIHLGLMQGVLEGGGAPITVDRLDPFVEPDLCLAHLTPRASAGC